MYTRVTRSESRLAIAEKVIFIDGIIKKTPCWRQVLCIIDRGLVIVKLHNFTVRIDIPPWPWALCGFNPLTNFKIFLQSISKSLSLFCVYNIWFVGRMLLLAIGWDYWTKKMLKMLTFSLKLEIRLLLTKWEVGSGIIGVSLPLTKVFIMHQYVLLEVFQSFSFFARLL